MIARNVDVGSTVRAEDVLAKLDEADARNALEGARSAVTSAQATVDQQRPQLERQQHLLEAAEAHLQSAQANYKLAEDQLAYTMLVADHDGIVTTLGAEVGQVVPAG